MAEDCPIVLLEAGRELRHSCFECGWSGALDLRALAKDPYTAAVPLPNLMRLDVLDCPACESPHTLIAGAGVGNHLLIARNPHPLGELASKNNVSLEGSDRSVFIPYGQDGKDADRRSPYIDLKTMPERLDSLPELNTAAVAVARYGGSGAFRRLLSNVNEQEAFCTVGCSWEESPHDDTFLCYGYIDLALMPLPESDYDTIRSLAEWLVEQLAEDADPRMRYLLGIKLGIFECRPLFVLDIESVGSGDTPREAFLCWEAALDRLDHAVLTLAAM